MNLLATLGTKLNKNILIGTGIKYFRERLDDKIAAAYALDFGILINQDKFNIGIASRSAYISYKNEIYRREGTINKDDSRWSSNQTDK
jgi:hypothetical protein